MPDQELLEIHQQSIDLIFQENYQTCSNLLLRKIQQDSLEGPASSQEGAVPQIDLTSYYLLGLSFLYQGKLAQAKEYLVAAYWQLIKIQEEKSSNEFEQPSKTDVLRHQAFSELFY